MKQSYIPIFLSSNLRKYSLFVALLAYCVTAQATEEKFTTFFPPPDITITCNYWFPFNPNNPDQYVSELDARFGKIVNGPSNRDKVIVRDQVCPRHPRFAEFAPASPFDDPCYDDLYDINWGFDGYYQNLFGGLIFQNVTADLVCGQGDIIREWRYREPWGQFLGQQRITIINCEEFYVPTVCWRFTPRDVGSCDFVGNDFGYKLVEWPCDLELTTCQATGAEAFKPENLDVPFDQDRRPRLNTDRCNLLAATYEDRVFTFVDSACSKVFREWEVINWCLYEQFEEGTYSGEFVWRFVQVIKLLNQDGPDFANCDDQTLCAFGDTLNPNNNQCVGVFEIRPDVSDDCTPLELLRIDYKLDLGNDGVFDRLGYSANYGPNYPFPNPNGLPVQVMPDTLPNADGVYPVGTHRILWGAEDGCGNINVCEYLLTIEDCKPPTPYCLPGISGIPMPVAAGEFIDIWASDFNLASFDNCTADSNLVYAFSEDPNDRTIRRTCDEVTGLAEQLTIYVFDEAGNFATCVVSIVLQQCNVDPRPILSGRIASEEDKPIKEVRVRLEGVLSHDMYTPDDGSYFFQNVWMTGQSTIILEKNDNPLAGVSTYDLVLMSRHILGFHQLTSPYKLIAADVNCSGSISAFDMVDIRRMVLGRIEEFGCKKSWRFVLKDYVFPSEGPFSTAFPEVYSITDPVGHIMTDFIGVKLGDLNNSVPLGVLGTTASGRGKSGELVLRAEDRMVRAGEQLSLEVSAEDFARIVGYQYTLEFDPAALAYDGMESMLASINEDNFGLSQLAEGKLTTSWHNLESVATDGQATPLYRLNFRALQSGRLSDWLSLNSAAIDAEAYTQDDQFLDVQLRLEQHTGKTVLYQNQPNPFKEQTTIGFELSEAGAVSLTITDVSGKVLKQINGNYAKGYHEVQLNPAELSAQGVLFYSLHTKDEQLTKRMVLLQ